MSTIKLPVSAFPNWAQVIPEENWKTVLDSKIKDKLNIESSSASTSTSSCKEN